MNHLKIGQKLGLSFLLYLLILAVAGLAFVVQKVDAHSDPPDCTSVGVGLSITVYRSDGTTPVIGTVQANEMINYAAELAHLGGSKCNFEGGTVEITTPDGVVHDVTPGGGVPLVTFGSPVTSDQVSYVVSETDVSGGELPASAEYSNGIAHFGENEQSVSAYADISTPYEDVSLDVSKTAVPEYTEEYEWSIEKTVDPDHWSLFDGDSGTSEYTVTVTKEGPSIVEAGVSGEITVHNPAEYASATIESVDDEISDFGAVAVDCGVSFPYDLAPGEDLICTYSTTLPNTDYRTNMVTVTTSGSVGGGSGDAEIIFDGVNPTVINGSINVDDTNGQSWEFSDSGEQQYEKTFSCEAVEYTDGHATYIHDNTATILETKDYDTASVTVDCYELSVVKNADTEYARKYDWEITKDADKSSVDLEPGGTATVTYDVAVNVTGYTDMDWMVSGDIDIMNPSPDRSADLVAVMDEIAPDPAAVNCPALTVAPLSTLTCTYGPLALGDGLEKLNVATAEQQNYDFDPAGVPTDAGTTEYMGTADVIFGDPSELIDETIIVEDTLGGYLGEVHADDPMPVHFSYEYEVGPYSIDACGEYEIPNTASFITNDTQTTGSDDWLVLVTVRCPEGCTLTQGYWKTHSASGPAPYDENWSNIGDADSDGTAEEENEDFYLSGMTYLEVFRTPVKGNAYYQLAHQYMAAKLNILAGAYAPPEVTSAISDAEALLSTYTPDEIKGLKGNAKSEWTDLASTLASYNEGLIGPGHCDDASQEDDSPEAPQQLLTTTTSESLESDGQNEEQNEEDAAEESSQEESSSEEEESTEHQEDSNQAEESGSEDSEESDEGSSIEQGESSESSGGESEDSAEESESTEQVEQQQTMEA